MTFIKGIAGIGAAMLIGLSALSARAGYVVDLTQVGSDVVAKGSGAIDLTGLTLINTFSLPPLLIPRAGIIITGASATGDLFRIPAVLPIFGSGGADGDSGTGDLVGIELLNGMVTPALLVPHGYHSDSPLSDTATYLSQTLGLTPGTFETKWGPGANQNFTLVVGTVVPEPSTWAMMLLGFAGLGLAGWRHRRTACNV
jgi:PEP-CTERM motif